MSSNSSVTENLSSSTPNPIVMKLENRVRNTVFLFVALAIFTLVVSAEIPTDRRGNLTLLTAGLWIMWLWSLRRTFTVHVFGDDWIGVRTLFSTRVVQLTDVRVIEIQKVDESAASIAFHCSAGQVIALEQWLIDRHPAVEKWVSSAVKQRPVTERLIGSNLGSWN